jgi:hypothetical protein
MEKRFGSQIVAPFLTFLVGGLGALISFKDLDGWTYILLGCFIGLGVLFFAVPPTASKWPPGSSKNLDSLREVLGVVRAFVAVIVVSLPALLIASDVGGQQLLPDFIDDYIRKAELDSPLAFYAKEGVNPGKSTSFMGRLQSSTPSMQMYVIGSDKIVKKFASGRILPIVRTIAAVAAFLTLIFILMLWVCQILGELFREQKEELQTGGVNSIE